MGQISKIATLDGVNIFFDENAKDDMILLGRKEGGNTFIVGSTLDIEVYKNFLRKRNKHYNRELNLEEILK